MKNNLFKRFLERYVSAWTVLACDVTMSTLASCCVLLAAQLLLWPTSIAFAVVWIAASAILSALMFYMLRTYRIIVRYSTFHDVGRIWVAIFLKAVGLLAVMLLFAHGRENAYTTKIISAMVLCDMLITTFFLLLVRIVTMIAFDAIKKRYMHHRDDKTRVMLYVGRRSDKAVSLVTRLRSAKHYQIVGFIAPGNPRSHAQMAGVPVFFVDSARDLENLHDSQGVDAVLFPHEENVRAESDRLIHFCQEASVKTLVAPGIDEMDATKPLTSHAIRKIRIEDLLNRPEIKISMDEIKRNFQGKTILVTGAAGSIGSELCRQLATFGVGRLVMLDNAETPLHNVRLEFEERFPDLDFVPVIGDVRQPNRLNFIFRKYRPKVVFHAAAYKHVPLMEENPCEAVLANVIGSRNVADKCVAFGVEAMVMISTDKAVNPTNVMGCTKRLAEIYVQSLSLAIERGEIKGNTRFVTTRFGNVLGSNGSVIPRFTEQIENGGPVTVTHPEIERFFMTIPEACRLVMEAATFATGNNIFVFDMGKPVKIRHLAEQMIRLAGFRPGEDIKIDYCGLRPGEKLYEEVLADKENTAPTPHERIRVANVREYDYAEALEASRELERMAIAVDILPMVKLMKEIVPEFVSNNSPFQTLDHQAADGAKAKTETAPHTNGAAHSNGAPHSTHPDGTPHTNGAPHTASTPGKATAPAEATPGLIAKELGS